MGNRPGNRWMDTDPPTNTTTRQEPIMATTKTLISNIRSLACNGIISDAEAGKLIRKVEKQEAAAVEEAVVAEVAAALTAFVQPGIEYKISDLVKEVMGISAPCHGYKETKDEQKYRDGVAKPRMKAAIESLDDMVSITGSGAQTRYLFNGETPEVVEAMFELNGEECEEDSPES